MDQTEKKKKHFVEWTQDLVLGVEVIDTQHKKLIELINELAEVC